MPYDCEHRIAAPGTRGTVASTETPSASSSVSRIVFNSQVEAHIHTSRVRHGPKTCEEKEYGVHLIPWRKEARRLGGKKAEKLWWGEG